MYKLKCILNTCNTFILSNYNCMQHALSTDYVSSSFTLWTDSFTLWTGDLRIAARYTSNYSELLGAARNCSDLLSSVQPYSGDFTDARRCLNMMMVLLICRSTCAQTLRPSQQSGAKLSATESCPDLLRTCSHMFRDVMLICLEVFGTTQR